MYVLENNNKPATHFIEVYKYKGVHNSEISLIYRLDEWLNDTFFAGMQTIAIFKIRMK